MNRFTEKIKALLNEDLPGDRARLRMSPEPRGSNLSVTGLKEASVLILLYPRNQKTSIVLIKRTLDRGPHSGQISLPGGMKEDNDNNQQDTAIREATEETGINGNDVIILGKLTNLQIPVSNTVVSPFVGYIDYCPIFNPDPSEVEYLIEVDLDNLLNHDIIMKDIMVISGNQVKVPFFMLNGEKVWGATAMILAEFIDLAEKVVQDPHAQY